MRRHSLVLLALGGLGAGVAGARQQAGREPVEPRDKEPVSRPWSLGWGSWRLPVPQVRLGRRPRFGSFTEETPAPTLVDSAAPTEVECAPLGGITADSEECPASAEGLKSCSTLSLEDGVACFFQEGDPCATYTECLVDPPGRRRLQEGETTPVPSSAPALGIAIVGGEELTAATLAPTPIDSAAPPTAEPTSTKPIDSRTLAPTPIDSAAPPTAGPTAKPTFPTPDATDTAAKTECLSGRGPYEGVTDFCKTCCPACTAVVGMDGLKSNFYRVYSYDYWEPNEDFPGCACLDLAADDYAYYGQGGILLTYSSDCARITGDNNVVSGMYGDDAMYSNGDGNYILGWYGDDHIAMDGTGGYLYGGYGDGDVCTDLSGLNSFYAYGCDGNCFDANGARLDCATGDPIRRTLTHTLAAVRA